MQSNKEAWYREAVTELAELFHKESPIIVHRITKIEAS